MEKCHAICSSGQPCGNTAKYPERNPQVCGRHKDYGKRKTGPQKEVGKRKVRSQRGAGKGEFENNPAVLEFIDSLIERNFPMASAPKWVNYSKFYEYKTKVCMEQLIEQLGYGSSEYDDHNLAFGYDSDQLDTGSSHIHSAVDDFTTVVVPEKIVELYRQTMG